MLTFGEHSEFVTAIKTQLFLRRCGFPNAIKRGVERRPVDAHRAYPSTTLLIVGTVEGLVALGALRRCTHVAAHVAKLLFTKLACAPVGKVLEP